MTSLIKFYSSLALRRLPAMLLVVLIVSGIGVAVSVQWPAKYAASARLLVEGAQIPGDLAASTIRTSAEEQLQILQQRLMTRVNLLEIADKYDVFEGVDDMTPDDIVAAMRARTGMRTQSGRNRATLLTISFEADRPRLTANVVNEFVTLVLDENIRYRTDRAEGTEDFFGQEVERLSDELDIQKDRILRFKRENSDALPDNLAFRLERQSSLQERVTEALRRRADLEDQKERLTQVFRATGSLGATNTRDLPPAQRQLRELQAQLENALTIYSETNPRVVLLRTRIEQLEQVVAEQAGAGQSDQPDATSLLDVEISRINGEIETLTNLIEAAEAEIAELSDSIDRTPGNAIALEALERDYANVQNQYNAAVSRLAQAQTGERIELSSKGERITVIEQATVPNAPTSPNRPLIVQAGMVAGFAAAAGLFVLLELLNNAIRRPRELTTALGITPFAVLPYMPTRAETKRRRLVWTVLVVGAVAVAIGGLWAIQTYYMPLDLFVSKVLDRLGLGSIF